MSKLTTNQILALTKQVILPFHEIKRSHKLAIGRRRHENDVEHSWSVAVLACCLAPYIDPTLDLGKISQYAILHDLVELHAGDTALFTASDSHHASKAEREHAALVTLKAQHPAFPWLTDTITEYESFASPEARFVYAVDKYIAVVYDLLDKAAYLRAVGVTKARYDEVRVKHREKAYRHPGVGEYYDQILALIDEHPEYFHTPPLADF